LAGQQMLNAAVEINPRRMGGVPVLKGTRLTVAQALGELADSMGVTEVADSLDVEPNLIREMLNGLSLMLTRPFQK
jgi:uncharacterized protein (DUF433 family)